MSPAPANAVTTPLWVLIAELICLPNGKPATITSSNNETSSFETGNITSGFALDFKIAISFTLSTAKTFTSVWEPLNDNLFMSQPSITW